MPVSDDRHLFEKICLEGFQAGLSWLTILNKREGFRQAFAGFDFQKIAEFDESDVKRLLLDAGIVRHRGKIASTINNARRAKELRQEFGTLASYFWQFEPDEAKRPTYLLISSAALRAAAAALTATARAAAAAATTAGPGQELKGSKPDSPSPAAARGEPRQLHALRLRSWQRHERTALTPGRQLKPRTLRLHLTPDACALASHKVRETHIYFRGRLRHGGGGSGRQL